MFELIVELFIGVIWEKGLNFIGACVRFLFQRKGFKELLKDDLNPFVGLGLIMFTILLIVFANEW